MTIHAREGWLQVSTSIVPVQQPRDKMFIEEEVKHEDLSHGGLYTEEDTNSWSALIEYSNLHQAITKKITCGVCKNLGECSSQQSSQYPSCNLKKLIDNTVEGSNPFVKIDQALTKYGTYISAFVLLIWTIKFFIFTLRVPTNAECTEPWPQTGGSNCYDVCMAGSCTLHPGQTEAVPLNLQPVVPRGYTLLLKSRSGLALKGITRVGRVIDSNYCGEIKAFLHNSTKNPFRIKKGQIISQVIFLKHIDVTFDLNNDENIWNGTTYHEFSSTG